MVLLSFSYFDLHRSRDAFALGLGLAERLMASLKIQIVSLKIVTGRSRCGFVSPPRDRTRLRQFIFRFFTLSLKVLACGDSASVP
jgi:hypothetical protein